MEIPFNPILNQRFGGRYHGIPLYNITGDLGENIVQSFNIGPKSGSGGGNDKTSLIILAVLVIASYFLLRK